MSQPSDQEPHDPRRSDPLRVDPVFAHELAVTADGIFGPSPVEDPQTALTTLLSERSVVPMFDTMIVATREMLQFCFLGPDKAALSTYASLTAQTAIGLVWNDRSSETLTLAKRLAVSAVTDQRVLDPVMARPQAVRHLVTMTKLTIGISTLYAAIYDEVEPPSYLLRECLGVQNDPSVLFD